MNPPTIDVYRFLPDKSVLDSVVHSKALRRPVYASTTQGAVTRAWRIEAHGSLTQIAMIDWEQGSLLFGGVQRKLDDVLVKSKGLFQREWVSYRLEIPRRGAYQLYSSRIVMIGDVLYKWKVVEGDISGWSGSKKWRCTLLSGDPRDGPSLPGNQAQRRNSIATFTPPQQHFRNAELQIFANLPQPPRTPILPPHRYPVSPSASTHPAIPSHFARSHPSRPYTASSTRELQPRSHAEYTAVTHLGGQLRPRAVATTRVSIGGEPARDQPLVSANEIGYTASFPAPLAHTPRSGTPSLPRANEFSSQNLIGPRRNRGPSDGILTGAISPPASERRQPAPIASPSVALESPPLAMIDGLMICGILLAAGRLEYRGAQSEPPASSSSPSAPLDQGTLDGPPLTMSQQRDLGISSQFSLPRHILGIQRQLYESYMAVVSTSSLPTYEAIEESSAGVDFRSIENQPSPLPPSYSVM